MRAANPQITDGHLALTGLAPQLRPDFIKLRNPGSAHWMALALKTAGCVDGFWSVQTRCPLSNRLVALAGFKKTQVLDVHQLSNRKTIVYFGKLDVIRCQTRHSVGLLSRIARSFKISQIFTGMKPSSAALPQSCHSYWIIGKGFGDFFGHQQHAAGPITDRATVKKMHGPGNHRVGARISQKILFGLPVRCGSLPFNEAFLFFVHQIRDGDGKLGFGVQGCIVMTLDRDIHQVFTISAVSGKIGCGHSTKNAGKGKTRPTFVGHRRQRQSLGHFFGGAFGHLFHATNQNNIIKTGSNGKDTLSKGQCAGGTGAFGSGRRLGRNTHQVRDNRPPVRLVHKIVIAKIPQIKRIDVFGIKTLFHRNDHFPECIGKQILGIFIPEHTEFGHPGPDDGHTATEFSAFLHSSSANIGFQFR